jgi:hypothetical protein
MITNFKIFEKINNKIEINSYNDIFKYTSEDYVDEFGFEGFNYEDDAIEYLNELLTNEYPHGLKNIPNKVKIYRILFLENKDEFNKNEFGCHYFTDTTLLWDSDFILRIGGEEYDWDIQHPYVFELLIDRNEIDFSHTISNNLLYPNEFEITTKTKNPNIEILNIKDYEDY